MMRRFAAIDGRGVISVEEEPVSSPEAGEILVDVYASLISPGTELGGVKRQRANPDSSRPGRAFGYSNAGVVLEVGEGVEAYAPGDPVACMGGGYALHATHGRIPQNLSVPMPEGISYEEASSNHLVATAMHAVRRAELQLGENVAIVGLGLVGQLSGQLARLSGAHVLGLDRFPMRLEIARNTGFDEVVNVAEADPVEIARTFTRGYDMDCAIMCFGGDGTEAFKQAVAMMKTSPDTHKMGRVVIVGGASISHTFAAGLGNLDVRSSARPGAGYHDEAWEYGKREYPPVFMQWTTKRNLEESLRLIQEKRLLVEPLITHRYPLAQAPEACEVLIEHPEESLGVLLLPER